MPRAFSSTTTQGELSLMPGPVIITQDEIVELGARLRRTLDDTYREINA